MFWREGMLNLFEDTAYWGDTPLSQIVLNHLHNDERVALLVAISSHDLPVWQAPKADRIDMS
jgi:hypothetical protein